MRSIRVRTLLTVATAVALSLFVVVFVLPHWLDR
jgi:hypothetical protein